MSQGHIRPQGEGSWEIKFDLGPDPLTGHRVTKSFRANDGDTAIVILVVSMQYVER